MKTLYVSDLDGTLLSSNQRTSKRTNQIINQLVDEGMLFSYATARSFHTARKVTQGLNARIPLIVYNGTFVMDNVTRDIIISNYFEEDIHYVITDLLQHHIYPIVYSFIDGEEKFSFLYDQCSTETQHFIDSRQDDLRYNPVEEESSLYLGHIFYITCIGNQEQLTKFYDKYKNQYHCLLSQDIYTNEQWLEFLPNDASKAQAILQLKKHLQCERVVVFGDGKNDLDMFDIADESYAVENAVLELKEKATGVIGHHDEDSVAQFIKQHFYKNR